jgi:hypothetical protein
MLKPEIMYFNGVHDEEPGLEDALVIGYLGMRGFKASHYFINWKTNNPFSEELDKATDAVSDKLESLDDGTPLVLMGVSGGVSMVENVRYGLKNPNLIAILICGRVKRGDYAEVDPSSLYATAAERDSGLYVASVEFAEDYSIPGLTVQDHDNTLVVNSRGDKVVPPETTLIESVRTTNLFMAGHLPSCGLGIIKTPGFINTHLTRQ